jgi:hypothetical protein
MRPLSAPERNGQEASHRRGGIAREMAAFLWAIGREVAPM